MDPPIAFSTLLESPMYEPRVGVLPSRILTVSWPYLLVAIIGALVFSHGCGGDGPCTPGVDCPSVCNDPTGICDWGDIQVTVSTLGTDLDPDGYDVLVDGSYKATIGVNGSQMVRARAGSHEVELGDVASNCEVQGTLTRGVSVTAGGMSQAPFSVQCTGIPSGTPALSVSSTSLVFLAAMGEDAASQTLTVQNTGDEDLTWSASVTDSWIGVSPESGSLGAGESALLTVTASTGSLTAGDHTGTITVTAPGADNSPQSVSVKLTVTPPGQQTLTVTGTGNGNGTVTSSPAGISCTITGTVESGSCAASYDEGTTVTLSQSAASGHVFLGWGGACTGTGGCTVTMSVARSVSARFDAELEITTTGLPGGQVGQSYSQTLAATGGSGAKTWSVTSGSLPAGLSLSSAGVISGTPTTAQTSGFTVQVASGGQTDTQALSITISSSGRLQVTPTALSFVTLEGAPAPAQALTIRNTGGSSLNWTITGEGDTGWVTLSETSGTLAPGTQATVSVGTDNSRSPDIYEGSLRVESAEADNSPQLVSLRFTVHAPGYQIDVRVSPGSSLSAAQATAVSEAVARWEAIITGDLQSIDLVRSAGTCASASHPALDESIDDLVIYLEFVPIDGPGNTLGSAGPCLIRTSDGLPLLGGMKFDTADLEFLETEGLLEAVIVHEMGHVLGIGTLWDQFGYLQNPSSEGGPLVDTHFNGPLSISAFNSIGGTGYTGGAKVPAENDNQEPPPVFGAGSLNGHWREGVFSNELMTPAVNYGSNPLSVVSIESLADIGYVVNTAAADPFTVSFDIIAGVSKPALILGGDVWRGRIEVVDESGRVVGSSQLTH